jgi:GntR family transcriptional regulator
LAARYGYKQIAWAIRQAIEEGLLAPGSRIPTERQLAAQYGVNRSTITSALAGLRAEGLLVTDGYRGDGTYVAPAPTPIVRDLVAQVRQEWARALTGDISGALFEEATGRDDVQVDVDYAWEPLPGRACHMLHLPPATVGLRRTFDYRVDGQPHQVAHSYLPQPVADAAGLTGPACEQPGVGTLAQLYRAGIVAAATDFVMSARPPTLAEAEHLGLNGRWPVVEHWRLLSTADGPVEVSTSVVRGDQVAYQFRIVLEPPQ